MKNMDQYFDEVLSKLAAKNKELEDQLAIAKRIIQRDAPIRNDYADCIKELNHEREKSAALIDRLNNAEDILRIIYHTTQGKTKQKAYECAEAIKQALEKWRTK